MGNIRCIENNHCISAFIERGFLLQAHQHCASPSHNRLILPFAGAAGLSFLGIFILRGSGWCLRTPLHLPLRVLTSMDGCARGRGLMYQYCELSLRVRVEAGERKEVRADECCTRCARKSMGGNVCAADREYAAEMSRFNGQYMCEIGCLRLTLLVRCRQWTSMVCTRRTRSAG